MQGVMNALKGPGTQELFGREQQNAIAGELSEHAGINVYPASICLANGRLFALARDGRARRFIVLARRGQSSPFDGPDGTRRSPVVGGEQLELALVAPTHDAATRLRQLLPWTAPRMCGPKLSAGLGDRLGLATPGHVRAVTGTGCFPFFAQQSIREMTRTRRTPDQVMDDATWGVFQAGWREGFGSDADHLKTTADIDATDAVGFTMFTIDPGDHVRGDADAMDASALSAAMDALPWSDLEISPADLRKRYLGRPMTLSGGGQIALDDQMLARAAAKYAAAIAHTVRMFRHLKDRRGSRPFELEVSVDETATPTTVQEHYLIAAELKRLGVHWASLAPRFVGAFEKGIDYRGNLDQFERTYLQHIAVACTLGPYKLSLHSGSDKFSIYPIVAEWSGGMVHLKTAGTSYLEALRVVARRSPVLFRRVLDFAFERFEDDRASYHISARLENLPRPESLADEALEGVLDTNDGRQLLHVTYGSVLTGTTADGRPRFRDDLRAVLIDHEEEHYAVVAEHLARHVQPFAR